MAKELCLLYASCIPVKGSAKSIICDLQRQNYVYIPNDLYNILIEHPSKSIDEIKAFYDNKYDDVIENYFQILIKNDFAFLTDTPELFPKLKLDWFEPFDATNAVIDINSESKFDVRSVLKQLSALSCKFVQIRFYKDISKKELEDLFQFLNNIESNTIGVDILMPFNVELETLDYKMFFEKYRRLNNLIVYASPRGRDISSIEHSRYYIHTGVNITSEKHCGVIDKALFSVNTKTFTESLNYNSCLNGKISIDKHGDIKNCPSMPQSFGNIKDTSLQQALADKVFKKYWNLSKDSVKVCSDCEFRYICTDCRAYTENPENDKSKPLKCGYDPYTGKWSSWSESALKKESISYYDL